jgi:hypothetical protein
MGVPASLADWPVHHNGFDALRVAALASAIFGRPFLHRHHASPLAACLPGGQCGRFLRRHRHTAATVP